MSEEANIKNKDVSYTYGKVSSESDVIHLLSVAKLLGFSVYDDYDDYGEYKTDQKWFTFNKVTLFFYSSDTSINKHLRKEVTLPFKYTRSMKSKKVLPPIGSPFVYGSLGKGEEVTSVFHDLDKVIYSTTNDPEDTEYLSAVLEDCNFIEEGIILVEGQAYMFDFEGGEKDNIGIFYISLRHNRESEMFGSPVSSSAYNVKYASNIRLLEVCNNG